MAKQQKSVPTIYEGLKKDPSLMRHCVVIDDQNNISVFLNAKQLEGLKSFEELIKPTLQARWDNFDAFLELNEQTLLTHHANIFGAEPPAKQDRVTTASLTWYKLIANAKNNLMPEKPTDPLTGKASTKSSRKYFPGEIKEGTADIKTHQALQCLKLFRAVLGDRTEITESELKQYIEDHVGELQTRQPAWRIFQYYRPTLIKAKLLRHD